jgi:hypothetical protein
VLHDDLDFDPTKRSNKEILRKMVAKEEERKGASKELDSFSNLPSRSKPRSNIVNDSDVVQDKGEEQGESKQSLALSSNPVSPAEEEIDLVEQLYGANQSLRVYPADLSDSIVLPSPPKNKDLDIVAWSRSSSLNPETKPPTPRHPVRDTSVEDTDQHAGRPGHVLSLDEYSERMKTAAIMLAQLNANLVWEPVTSVPTPGALPDALNSHGTKCMLN